jgi:hypothetical protein
LRPFGCFRTNLRPKEGHGFVGRRAIGWKI